MTARISILLLSCYVFCLIPTPVPAAPPVEIEFQDVFDDINPCTGLVHTVTIAGTLRIQAHGDHSVGVAARTITTSPTGFVGHGTQAIVENDTIFVLRLLDVLTNAAGDRIRARFVLVVDSDDGTVKVQKGEVICLGTGR